MADEQEKQVESSGGKKSGFNIKILLIGIPLFVIQLVAVYFITANFLLSKMQSSSSHDKAKSEEVSEGNTTENSKSGAVKDDKQKVEFGKFIYVVDDLLVNPANTEGKRLLLTSLGFDVASKENEEELKTKDVLLKDAVLSVMSSKNFSQLANLAYRDTLRIEITKRIQELMPKVKINTIYFSKYILQ